MPRLPARCAADESCLLISPVERVWPIHGPHTIWRLPEYSWPWIGQGSEFTSHSQRWHSLWCRGPKAGKVHHIQCSSVQARSSPSHDSCGCRLWCRVLRGWCCASKPREELVLGRHNSLAPIALDVGLKNVKWCFKFRLEVVN